MAQSFPAFPREALTFLRQLEKNNTRDWFQPRREMYEEKVRAPMLRLVESLSDDVRKFAPDHIVDPKKAVYRIYRDTRFSKDKTPYKTHIAALFPAKGLPKHVGAGFYFHISPQGVEIAGGMYMPGPADLAAVRQAIAGDFPAFKKLVEARALARRVGALRGEKLSRVPRGFGPDHPAAEYLRMKQYYFYISLPVATATSPRLRSEIASRFRAMAPVIHWMNGVALAAVREQDGNGPSLPRRPEPMF